MANGISFLPYALFLKSAVAPSSRYHTHCGVLLKQNSGLSAFAFNTASLFIVYVSPKCLVIGLECFEYGKLHERRHGPGGESERLREGLRPPGR